MYDYVIVGAGSAGCVLAARLSEDPDVRVALLEAGGQDTKPEIAMPAAFPMLLKSSIDWDLYGEPEPGLGGPAPVPAARQGGRRIGLDQRDDLPARQPRRLRRLGGRRGHGLELRRGPALLQALRGQRARRGRVPRRRRAAQRVGQPLADPAGRHHARGERARGARLHPGLQRRAPGWRGALPEHAAQRTAPLDRGRVPAPGRVAAEPGDRHRRDGPADPVRRARARWVSRSRGMGRSRRSGPRAR